MPMVLIEIASQYTQEKESALMKVIQSALLKIFKVTEDAINIRLLVHEAHRFLVPANMNPELYALVSIDCFIGRSLATKRCLYAYIAENFNLLGIPKDHIKIVIRESQKENWGILGGRAGCDVDVGYPVENS